MYAWFDRLGSPKGFGGQVDDKDTLCVELSQDFTSRLLKNASEIHRLRLDTSTLVIIYSPLDLGSKATSIRVTKESEQPDVDITIDSLRHTVGLRSYDSSLDLDNVWLTVTSVRDPLEVFGSLRVPSQGVSVIPDSLSLLTQDMSDKYAVYLNGLTCEVDARIRWA